jgi:hypothetical protein
MVVVEVLVTVADDDPASDCGLLYPDPEFIIGISVMVTCGEPVSDPLKVKSGRMRYTNPRL